jgi:hypothetical protein
MLEFFWGRFRALKQSKNGKMKTSTLGQAIFEKIDQGAFFSLI